MEPMNPYERRIIHSAISQMEGLRSESKGEGKDRHVVIYSTEPGAQTEVYERRPRGGRDKPPAAITAAAGMTAATAESVPSAPPR